MDAPLDRTRKALRSRGLIGFAWHLAGRIRRMVQLDAEHVWYQLDLTGERPRPELPAGVSLRRGTKADLAFVTAMSDQVGETTVRRRYEAGAPLWVLERARRIVGFFWAFDMATPSVIAPREALRVPDGVVAIDDTFTIPLLRGKGLGPAAWGTVADMLASSGKRAVVMTIEPQNRSSRRAAEKAGFRELGFVRLRRRLGRTRVAVRLSGPPGAFGARLLELQR